MMPLDTDQRWVSSTIRDLLGHARRPGTISLAGGLPAEESLPVERLAVASATMFDRFGAQSLQYSATAGEPALRELLASNEAVHPDDLVVTTGSQQALDLVVRSLSAPGQVAIVDAPGYVGAIQALRANGLQLLGCQVDSNGLDTDALERHLLDGVRPAIVYTNPIHQNPTGGRLSPRRADHLTALAERFGFWVVADDPYREITFEGDVPSPEAGLHPSTSDHVILLGSLSKTLSPGLRIGWCSGSVDAIRRIVIAKQAADLHTPSLNQLVAASVLSDHAWWVHHLRSLRSTYRVRHDALHAALDRHLPGATTQAAAGGFFSWLDLPGIDTTELLETSLDAGVAFVPGSAFTTDGAATSSLRLSYSSANVEHFDRAIETLADVVSAAVVRS